MSTSLGNQLRIGALAVAGALLVVLAVILAAEVVDRPFWFFSREPAEQLGGPSYTGYEATFASIVWLSGVLASFFAALALRHVADRRELAFLTAGGAFTALLVADDVFLLHESIYSSVGLDERLLYVLYAIAGLAYLIGFRREILAAEPLLLVVGGACLALSTVVDQFLPGRHEIEWRHVLEDGVKLVGIALWTAFLVRVSLRAVRARIH